MGDARCIAGADEAAVAAGRAPADALGLEDRDPAAGAGQFDRRGQPRQAAADDGNVDLDGAGQRVARSAGMRVRA